MNGEYSLYVLVAPLLIFGPLFLWVLYNLGIREMFRIPEEMRQKRQQDRKEADRFKEEHALKRGKGLAGASTGPNKRPLGLIAQAVTYAWFAAVIGFFAASPPYAYSDPDTAQIKVSLSHPGKRKVECRLRTREELTKLPANMRAPKDCSRERLPVSVELVLDGTVVMAESGRPGGLAKDGPSVFYRVITIPSGRHGITMRLDETGNGVFDFEKTLDLDLFPGRALAVQFNAAKGGFIVK